MNISPSDETCFHPNRGLGQKINPKVSHGSSSSLGARAGREMLWGKGAGASGISGCLWHQAAVGASPSVEVGADRLC